MWGGGRGAAAEENFAHRLSNCRLPFRQCSGSQEAFRQGLRELGYVEGKNIVIEWRSAEGKIDRLPALAAELVRLKVDVIVTGGPTATRAVKQATTTIPIVMTQDSDPVGNGFVASLARPGGNITGLSNLAQEISGKRLEILREIVPKLSRVAVLGMSNNPGNSQSLRETELAASALGVQIQYLDIRDSKDIEAALRTASKERADAVLVLNFPGNFSRGIPDLAVKNRLPAIYYNSTIVDNGGLMSYGASITDLGPARRNVCGQDFERRQARRSACRAAHEVRSDHQYQGGQANRSDDSAECAGAGGQSH